MNRFGTELDVPDIAITLPRWPATGLDECQGSFLLGAFSELTGP
jgi:hypothetical protein